MLGGDPGDPGRGYAARWSICGSSSPREPSPSGPRPARSDALGLQPRPLAGRGARPDGRRDPLRRRPRGRQRRDRRPARTRRHRARGRSRSRRSTRRSPPPPNGPSGRPPGLPGDAVVWEEVEARTSESTELNANYLAFIVLACLIASVGIFLGSPILIVGAMVVGPEFGPLAGLCVAARPAPLGGRAALAAAPRGRLPHRHHRRLPLRPARPRRRGWSTSDFS